MMKAMIPPQVGMRLRTLQKEKKAKKEKGQKEKKKGQIKKREKKKREKRKNERKREKGQCYYPFYHTCASK